MDQKTSFLETFNSLSRYFELQCSIFFTVFWSRFVYKQFSSVRERDSKKIIYLGYLAGHFSSVKDIDNTTHVQESQKSHCVKFLKKIPFQKYTKIGCTYNRIYR